MATPLLLDVDGVLNAFPIWSGAQNFPPQTDVEDAWSSYETFNADLGDGREFTICFAPDLCGALKGLTEEGVDIRWLTTWGALANKVLSERFDFPQFPVVGEPDYDYPRWWKLPLAQKVFRESGRLVWCDDDINTDRDGKAWVDSEPNVLAIVPDHFVGLRPSHIESIRAFCKGDVDAVVSAA